jgi:FMN-dependent NADH-azoreductase
MKTLIVKYLPTGAESKTKLLLDLFLEEIKGQNVEIVDLLKEEIPTFDEHSIQAYYKRNYGGLKLDSNEAKLLEKNDKLIAQLKSADVLVMAHPMHNFSIPARSKAYLDSVIFKGETFEMGKKMMMGKKALTLFTSGGVYNEELVNAQYPNWNTLEFVAKINFGFMGFDEAEVIGNSLRDEETRAERLEESKKKIQAVVRKWYK